MKPHIWYSKGTWWYQGINKDYIVGFNSIRQITHCLQYWLAQPPITRKVEKL